MKIECPECGGKIRREENIITDIIHEIDNKGNVKIVYNKDNSGGVIYCVNDGTHVIHSKLLDKIHNCINKFQLGVKHDNT